MRKFDWPLILVIEDNERQWSFYKNQLEKMTIGKIDFLKAFNIQEAYQLIDRYVNQIDAMIIGEIQPENRGENSALNSIDFVRKARQSFSGPMIAAANTQQVNNMLVCAGCNHGVSDKEDIPDKVYEILERHYQ